MYTHICQSTFPLSTNPTYVLWSGPPWRSQVEFSPGMGWEWALKSGRNLIHIYHLLHVHQVYTYIILIRPPCEVCIITFTEKRKWTQCGNSLSHLSVLARTDTFLFPIFTAIPSCTYIQVSSSIRGNFWKIQKKNTVQSSWPQQSLLIESFHGRAINLGQEHLEAGGLFSLPVRTQPTHHPSHRPRECLMKPIWINGDRCLGLSPRPLKWPGNVPIFGQESSAYCGSIFKEIKCFF